MEEFDIDDLKKAQLKRITIHTPTHNISNENILNSKILNSSEYFEDNNNNQPQFDLYFLIQGVKYHQDTAKALKSCPLISKVLKSPQSHNLHSAPIVLELPPDVTLNSLNAFYSYSISPSLVGEADIGSVLIMSEYFQNTVLSKRIMQNDIMPSMNHLNAVRYLILSLDKLTALDREDNKEIWNQLYGLSHSCIVNALNIMSNADIIRLHSYNNNLFFELLQSHCHSVNCSIKSNKSNNDSLLSSIESIFNCTNLLIVIDALYKEKFKPKSIEYLATATIPKTIEIKAEYKEQEIKLDNHCNEIVQASIAFNPKNCVYNLTITPKSKEGLFMYSLIYINGNKCSGDNSFLTGFSPYTNYAINRNSFSSKGTFKKNNYCFLQIQPDYTFTTLVNYLINHIDTYISSFNLINNNLGLMIQLLLSLKSKAVNQNTLLSIVLNWLSNECNATPENIVTLSEHINWRLIKIELISEVYIKYSFALKKNLSNMLAMILKENKMDKIAMHMTNALCSGITCSSFDKNNDKQLSKIRICSAVSSVQFIGISLGEKTGPLQETVRAKYKTRGVSNLTTSSTQFAHTSRSRKSESCYSGNTNLIHQLKTPFKDNIMSKLINNLLKKTEKK